MANHFITKCSCGAVLSQCRCPGPKTETIIERGCPNCHGSSVTVKRQGQDWFITDRLGSTVRITQADWRHVNGIIHEHYHGDDCG